MSGADVFPRCKRAAAIPMKPMRKADLLPVVKRLDDLLGKHAVLYGVSVHDLYLRIAACPEASVPEELVGRLHAMFEGTMGSLTDLCISKANGHIVDDEAEANRCLDAITDDLWRLLSERDR